MIAHSYSLWRQLHSCNRYNGGRERNEMFGRLLRRNFSEQWSFVVSLLVTLPRCYKNAGKGLLHNLENP